MLLKALVVNSYVLFMYGSFRLEKKRIVIWPDNGFPASTLYSNYINTTPNDFLNFHTSVVQIDLNRFECEISEITFCLREAGKLGALQ